MTDWFVNGQAARSIDIDDRGFRYGDGLFETVAVRGGRARLWDYHMDRLAAGARVLELPVPAADELLHSLMRAVDDTRRWQDCVGRILVTAGSGPRGYRRRDPLVPTVVVGVADATQLDPAVYPAGIDTHRCRTRLAPQPRLAGLKTLGRLEQVLASNEWQDSSVFEGLMCDSDGHLICGTMSNVFVVQGQQLSTPDLSRCGVAGVMRRHVIALQAATGAKVIERDLRWDGLGACDEVFVCNSQFGALPVRACGDYRWPVGPVTRSVLALLAENGVAEVQP